MTYSFVFIEISICMLVTFPNGLEKCDYTNSWLPSFVTGLPAFFRLVQCFRRFYDSHDAHPHLSNAVKYALSLATILFSLASRFAADESAVVYKVLWIGMHRLTSV
jgi:hypothetical protein